MSHERLNCVCARWHNTDMGPIPSEGGARSAWRAGLSVALCLSILGMADAASGQSLRNGFYTGLELGRANASPLTSSVTGVNHPTRCDRLPLSGIDQPAGQRRGVPRQHADGHPAQRVRPGGRGRERPPGRLPGRPGARRGGVPHPVPGARHRGGRGHHERGAPGQGHRVERRPAAARVDPGLRRPPDLRQPVLRLSERVALDAVRRRRPGRGHHHPAHMPTSSSGSRKPSTCASTSSRTGQPPPSAPQRVPSAPSIRRCVKKRLGSRCSPAPTTR